MEVAAPVEDGEVLVDIVPGPSAEAVGFLSFLDDEFLSIFEALAFGGGFPAGSYVVFAKHVFWMESFDDSNFKFRHVFSP